MPSHLIARQKENILETRGRVLKYGTPDAFSRLQNKLDSTSRKGHDITPSSANLIALLTKEIYSPLICNNFDQVRQQPFLNHDF
ncbi:hypothetical protein BCON_0127g00010 [Botryotinia convoluta]|uniref:Uncharacterized protein n=1 Tax=Botryotinia convoluta TaxID=54673 RepID=A0A4Z1HVI2_9HELO|nr:hypothetical protein BCON_0127g00010 [Botryotinia convoluta]